MFTNVDFSFLNEQIVDSSAYMEDDADNVLDIPEIIQVVPLINGDRVRVSWTPVTKAEIYEVRVRQPLVSSVVIDKTVQTTEYSNFVVYGLVPGATTYTSVRSVNSTQVSAYSFEQQTTTLQAPSPIRVDAGATLSDNALYSGGHIDFALHLAQDAPKFDFVVNAFGNVDALHCEVRVPGATAWLDADHVTYGLLQGSPGFQTYGFPCLRQKPPAFSDDSAHVRRATLLGASANAALVEVRLQLSNGIFASHACTNGELLR